MAEQQQIGLRRWFVLQHLKPIADPLLRTAYIPIIPEKGLNAMTQPVPSRDSFADTEDDSLLFQEQI